MENYDELKREIGQRVAAVRKKAGEKQTELAEAVIVLERKCQFGESGTDTETRSPESGRSTPST